MNFVDKIIKSSNQSKDKFGILLINLVATGMTFIIPNNIERLMTLYGASVVAIAGISAQSDYEKQDEK